MGLQKTKPPFKEEKVKSTEILSEKELKLLSLYLSGDTRMNSFLTIYPQKSSLKNSELLNEVERLFSLPRMQKFIREHQH